MPGVITAIYLCPTAEAAATSVQQVRALAGRGLEGDRYALGTGSFSRFPGTGREVTFIESEVIDDVLAGFFLDLSEGKSRRNVVTQGVRLDSLLHRTFRIGSALFHGDRPADPCAVLERYVGPGLMEALRGRGGLRASIVQEGDIHVGDAIEIVSRTLEE